jgi:excisionase family DNA binding protein
MVVRYAYTPETLAEQWEVSSATVRNIIRAGQLRAFRIGRQIRIRPEAVTEYEDRQCQSGGLENTEESSQLSEAKTERPSGSRLGPVIGARRSGG